MKKYLLFFAGLLLLGACKKDIKSIAEISQNITYEEEIDLSQSFPFPLPVEVDTSLYFAFATNFEYYLNQFNTSPEKVIHAKFKSMTMEVTQPATGNFDFLSSLEVYIYNNGLPELLAAYKNPIPKGIKTLELDIVDQNIKQYFLQDSMRVRLRGLLNATPQTGTKINLKSVFNIRANPLN